MATIQNTIDVAAPIEKVWAKISDVGKISGLLGMLVESKITGNKRVCTLGDGGVLHEDIITINPDMKRVVYSITESPLNLDFHVAEMALSNIDTGTRLVWTVDVIPAEAVPHLEPVLSAASEDLKKSLAT